LIYYGRPSAKGRVYHLTYQWYVCDDTIEKTKMAIVEEIGSRRFFFVVKGLHSVSPAARSSYCGSLRFSASLLSGLKLFLRLIRPGAACKPNA